MKTQKFFRMLAGLIIWLPFAIFLLVGITQGSALRRGFEREMMSLSMRYELEKLMRVIPPQARLSLLWSSLRMEAASCANISQWHERVTAGLISHGVASPSLYLLARDGHAPDMSGGFAELLQKLFEPSLIPLTDEKSVISNGYIDLPIHLFFKMPRRNSFYLLPLPRSDWLICHGLVSLAGRPYSYLLFFKQDDVDQDKIMDIFHDLVLKQLPHLWKRLPAESGQSWLDTLHYSDTGPDGIVTAHDYLHVYSAVYFEDNFFVFRSGFSGFLLLWEFFAGLAFICLSLAWLGGFARIDRLNFPIDSANLKQGLLLFLGPAIGLPLLGLVLVGHLEIYSENSSILNEKFNHLSLELEEMEVEFNNFVFAKQQEISAYLAQQQPFVASAAARAWCEEINCGKWNIGYLHVFSSAGEKLSPTWFQFRPSYTHVAHGPERMKKWFLRRVSDRNGKIETLYQSLLSLPTDQGGFLSQARIVEHLRGPMRDRLNDPNDPVIDKFLSGLAQQVCRRVSGQPPTSSGEGGKQGVMSVMAAAAGVEEEDYVNETVADLGRISRIVSGSEKLFNLAYVLGDPLSGPINFVLMHWRAGHFSFSLVLDMIEKARLAKDGSASYIFNRDAEGLDFASKATPPDLMAIVGSLEKPGENRRFIARSSDGSWNLYSLKRSENMEHLVIGRSLPLAALGLARQATDSSYRFALLLGLLWLGLGCYVFRQYLLKPVSDLEYAVEPLFRPGKILPVIRNPVGELFRLSVLFGEVKEGLDQLNLAQALQEDLFPDSHLNHGRLRIRGKSIMMEQVGGDFYDFFPDPFDENFVYVCIGDVTGHGLAAAIVVAMITSAIPEVVKTPGKTPEQLLTKINQHLTPMLKRLRMSSVMLMRIDSRTGEFALSGAGHPALIHVKPDNTHAFIEMNAFPLGASKNMKFPSCQMSIGDKCAIVFYTDGWVEALMPDGEMIGYREFAEIVAKTVKGSDNPIETLYGKLEKLTGTTSWGDDVSIVLLEFD